MIVCVPVKGIFGERFMGHARPHRMQLCMCQAHVFGVNKMLLGEYTCKHHFVASSEACMGIQAISLVWFLHTVINGFFN